MFGDVPAAAALIDFAAPAGRASMTPSPAPPQPMRETDIRRTHSAQVGVIVAVESTAAVCPSTSMIFSDFLKFRTP